MRIKHIITVLSIGIISIGIFRNNIPTYKVEYLSILAQHSGEYYSLLDFNNDKIPELIIIHTNDDVNGTETIQADRIEIYTYIRKEIKQLYQTENDNAFLFYENNKLIIEYANAQGTPCDIYEIQQGEMKKTQCGYSDEKGVHINWDCLGGNDDITYGFDENVCARNVLVHNENNFKYYRCNDVKKMIEGRL